MKLPLIKIGVILSAGFVVSACNFGDDKDLPTPNRAPNAMSEALTTQADIAIMDMVTATDEDGDPLTFAVTTDPILGTVTMAADGSYTYTPNPTVTGEDSFQFSVSDGMAADSTGTVTITIENQVVSFESYSRAAFAQGEQDQPLPTNGRTFTQDVTDPDAYDDLIPNP